jgi:DNA replication and repair protein RecF
VAGTSARSAALTFERVGKRKRIEVDGAPVPRLAQAIGHWIAVAFLPDDLTLAAGPAAARRRYLDRTLALAEPGYLGALTRFRSALRQRNAALRQRRSDLAQAFDSVLGTAGAAIVSRRMAWVEAWRDRFAEECAALGEREPAELAYTGNPGLADASAWTAALARSADQERATGMTRVGPHRDDLRISLAGRVARDFGSTGQQRGVAIALRLLERAVIDAARGQDTPILLDDVFAALDSGRQARLSQRLFKGRGQVFVTAPREDELPAGIQLPVWRVEEGRVTGH